MGLLDFDLSKALNSDRGRLGLGLLAAAGPSNQGFGQRLQSALGYVQGQQDRDTQKQMQQFQMQELLAQAAARKREADKQARAEQTQQKVSEYAKQFMPQVGPQIQGEPVDLMQPQKPQGFNMQGFLQGLPGVMDDPLQALEYAKKFAPEKEEAYTLGEGQQRFKGDQLLATGPTKPAQSPNKVQEYEYAKSQGYKGTFTDFVAIAPSIAASAIAPLRNAQIQNIESENEYNLPPPRTTGATVRTPDGQLFSFPNQQAANAFKMKAGIK